MWLRIWTGGEGGCEAHGIGLPGSINWGNFLTSQELVNFSTKTLLH